MTQKEKQDSNKTFSLHFEALKRGYNFTDSTYCPDDDELIIHGERRDVIAYTGGVWFTPEQAKNNATKKLKQNDTTRANN